VIRLDKFLKKIVVGSGITLLSMLIIKVMAIVNSVICARLLNPADFGALSIIVNLQSLVVMIACLGIPLSVTKHISQYEKADETMARSIASIMILMLTISSVISAAVYLLLSETIATDLYHDRGLISVIRLSSILVMVASVNMGLSAIIQGFQRISALAIVNTIVAVAAQPIAFASIGLLGLEGAVISLLISNLVSCAMLVYLSRRVVSYRHAKAFLKRKEHIRSLISFTIPAFVGGMTLVIAAWIGRTLLVIEWDLIEVGQFQIADNLSQTMLILSAAMSIPLLPMISELHVKNPRKVCEDSVGLLNVTMLLVLPLSIVAMPLMGAIITFLYGREYEIAYVATVIMFSFAAYKVVGSIISNVILGMGRIWDALFLNLAWLMGFTILGVILIRTNGANGLAGAYAASIGGYVLLLMFYFSREFHIALHRCALACIGYAAIVMIYLYYLDDLGFAERLAYAAGNALAIASIIYFGVLGEQEKRSLKGMMRLVPGIWS